MAEQEIAREERAEQVKNKGLVKPEDMNFVPKRWGYEVWITNNEKYCGKILFIRRGHQCSFHEHKLKDEVLYIREGRCDFRIHDPSIHKEGEEDHFVLEAGEAWHVTPGIIHQMTALSDVEIIEISTQHFDSDSYRKEQGKG